MRRLVSAELYSILAALFFMVSLVYMICTYTFAALLEHFWWLGPCMIGLAWVVSCIGSPARPPRHSHRNRRRK